MKSLGKTFFVATGVAVLAVSPAMATVVAGNNSSLTSLGNFAAGTYTITATGLVDLVGPPGSGFTIRPDGTPDSEVTTPGYAYFNPSGSTIADGNPGTAPGFKIGSLVGTFLSNPGAVNSDWFAIGYSTTITFGGGTIYALVNDTFASNNGGAFDVTVAPVPEPASWAMLIAGFGLVGATMRRRRRMMA